MFAVSKSVSKVSRSAQVVGRKAVSKSISIAAISPPIIQNSVRSNANGFKIGAVGAALYSTSKMALSAAAPGSVVEGFTKTKSGLQYKDTVIGTGATPKRGARVSVHYTGWLNDFEGKKFDSSYDRKDPIQFSVGVGQVIAGWDEALLTDMKVGGKRDIIIPSDLGYGSRGAGGLIPGNATLYFRIELVSA